MGGIIVKEKSSSLPKKSDENNDISFITRVPSTDEEGQRSKHFKEIPKDKIKAAFLIFSHSLPLWMDRVELDEVCRLLARSPESPYEGHDNLVDDFIFPAGTKQIISNVLHNREKTLTPSTESLKSRMEAVLTKGDHVFMALLIATTFPFFLSHPLLKKFLAATEDTYLPGEENQPPFEAVTTREKSLLDVVHSQDFQDMINTNSWVAIVDSFLDSFPCSVSIASRKPGRLGFPLVFINKAFTLLTGFDREAAIGWDCSMLQSQRTEEEQVRTITVALKQMQPVKLAITNRRADGTDFFNLLSLQPVRSAAGLCSHVIGIQFDAVKGSATLGNLAQIQSLLIVIKNIMS